MLSLVKRMAAAIVPQNTHDDTSPSDEQFAAIRTIEDWYSDRRAPQVFFLGGGAGTGKSFTANKVIERFKERNKVKKVVSGAYTGKGAHVLRKKGVKDAMTIHQMIYEPREDEETGQVHFVSRLDGPAAEADLILLDECSMIDERLANDILMFGKKVLVLGDPYQLPPVHGAGAFTKSAPDFLLREIHRQAKESPIVRLATMIRNGELPRRFGSAGAAHVLPLTPQTQRLVARRSTQTLCGVHKVRFAYTSRLRALRGFSGPMPKRGEPILCCKNNSDAALFNGMMGVMTGDAELGFERGERVFNLSVLIEDETKRRTGLPTSPWMFQQHFDQSITRPKVRKGIEEFDFGYVLTVHKAQGSEWDSVTVIDDSRVFRDDRWRWLYTAVTRASEELVLLLREDLGGKWNMPAFDDCPLPLAA